MTFDALSLADYVAKRHSDGADKETIKEEIRWRK